MDIEQKVFIRFPQKKSAFVTKNANFSEYADEDVALPNFNLGFEKLGN